MRILLVEDEQRLSEVLVTILEDNNYAVDAAYDGDSGIDLAQTGIYDLIVLDRMLPGKEGLEVLKEFRSGGFKTPVLLLTAKDTVEDKVEGLDAGADDYLVKPFATKELLARIRALARRQPDQLQSDLIQAGSTTLNAQRCEAVTPGGTIRLTYKESQLLELFMRNKEQVITKELILDKIWGMEFPVEMNNIEIYIHYLRKKLAPETCGIQIETIRGIGYCLKETSHV